MDGRLQSIASAWAQWIAAHGDQLQHQDLNALVKHLGLEAMAENLGASSGRGATTAGVLHVSLMQSDLHRANLLLPQNRLVGVGAVCSHGWLIVVEEFGTPFGVPTPATPTPPVNPIAAGGSGGAGC